MGKFLYPLLISLIAVAYTASASAQIYKWVDENGQVHFSERPPKNSNAQAYNVATPNPLNANGEGLAQYEKLKNGLKKETESRHKQQLAAKEAQSELEKRREPCEASRQRLNQLQSGLRLYETQDDGSKVWLDEKAISSKLAAEKEKVKTLCQGL